MFRDCKTVRLFLSFLVFVDLGEIPLCLSSFCGMGLLRISGVTIADCIEDLQSVIFFTVTLDWVQIVVSLSVNVAATCLIAFRAWQVEF